MKRNCNRGGKRGGKRGGGKKAVRGRRLCDTEKYEYLCSVKNGDVEVGRMNRKTGEIKNANARCAYACESIPKCIPLGHNDEKYPCKANNTVFVTKGELLEYIEMVERKPVGAKFMDSADMRRAANRMATPKLRDKGGIIKPVKAKLINKAKKVLTHRNIDEFKTVYSYLVHEVRVTMSVDIKNARKIASKMLKDIEKKIAEKEKKKLKKRKAAMAVKVISELKRMSKSIASNSSSSSAKRKKKNAGRKRVEFA